MMNKKDEMRALALEVGYPDTSYHEFLAELTASKNIVRYLEVGAHKGSTLFYVLDANPDCQAYVIDDFQLSTFDELWSNIKRFDFPGPSYSQVAVCEGNDLDELPRVMENFKPDFVHLDADHTSGGLLAELALVTKVPYPPKTIVVHDVIDPCVGDAIEQFSKTKSNYRWWVTTQVFNHAAVFELEVEK